MLRPFFTLENDERRIATNWWKRGVRPGGLKHTKAMIERETLLKGLSHLQSVVERRNTIPILSNVLLEANASGTLRLMATDLDLQINDTVEADVMSDGNKLETRAEAYAGRANVYADTAAKSGIAGLTAALSRDERRRVCARG